MDDNMNQANEFIAVCGIAIVIMGIIIAGGIHESNRTS